MQPNEYMTKVPAIASNWTPSGEGTVSVVFTSCSCPRFFSSGKWHSKARKPRYRTGHWSYRRNKQRYLEHYSTNKLSRVIFFFLKFLSATFFYETQMQLRLFTNELRSPDDVSSPTLTQQSDAPTSSTETNEAQFLCPGGRRNNTKLSLYTPQ